MVVQVSRGIEAAHRILLDLLFTPRCVICRRADGWFCAKCRSGIEMIPPPLCERCGRPLHHPECPYCRQVPLQIDGIRSVAFFEGNLRNAIHFFKYQQRPELGQMFGLMMSEYFSAHPLSIDVIVAVPLHHEREDARGYNQSLLLARALARKQNIPTWENVLTRVRATLPQVDLDAEARRSNVLNAFTATRRVADKHILLIDDVCTTGATMDACSVALKACGAKSV